MKHWIVIPTYNERENIIVLIPEIFLAVPDVEIVVVDDNSPDGTAGAVQSLQGTYPHLHLHVRVEKQGLGSAYIEIFRRLLVTRAFDSITTMDADFSHSPRDLPQMFTLAHRYDVVIGSRYVQGGATEGWALHRRILSGAGNLYARLVTGVDLHDLTSGFVTFRRNALEAIANEKIQSSGYAYTIESKCLAIFAGAHAIEMPIVFRERRVGSSKLAFAIIREAIFAPWRMRFRSRHKRQLPAQSAPTMQNRHP